MIEYNGFGIIYMFTSPSGKNYIGQTINFNHRFKKYKNNKDSVGKCFSNAIIKYKGIENFKLTILCKFELFDEISKSKAELNKLEIYYISKYKSNTIGYNLTAGGEGSYKRFVSEETRKKLSESNKGKNIVEKILCVCNNCKKEYFKSEKYLKNNNSKFTYCSKYCSQEFLKNDVSHLTVELVKQRLIKYTTLKEVYNSLKINKKDLFYFCKIYKIDTNYYINRSF